MAKQKFIFSTKAAFETGRNDNVKIKPYIRFNGSDMPNDTPYEESQYGNDIKWLNGTPTPVDGVVGLANQFNGESLRWRNWGFPAINRATISFWVKFSAADLSGWSILATNRGDGWANKGFHIASLDGKLNLRAYGTMSIDTYSTSTGQSGKTFKPDTWYHVAMIYDPINLADNLKVFVNGEQWISTYLGGSITQGVNSFQLGDMDGGYPMSGTIMDEFIVLFNENSWTVAQAIHHFNEISNGETIDMQSVDGSIILSKGRDGLYPTDVPVSWYSPTLNLGAQGKFIDYGLIQAVGQLPSVTTTLTFYTRSSSDGIEWEEWKAVDVDGKIQSTNTQYLEVRVDFETSDGMLTPQLDEIRVLEDVIRIPIPDLPKPLVKAHDPLTLYLDLDTGLHSLGEVRNAYDIIIEEQVNGEDKLTFKLPKNDKKRKEIGEEVVEMLAVIGDRHYIVKEIIDKREDDGRVFSEFICEAQWTELRDWYCDSIELVEVSAQMALDTIVSKVFREEGDPEFDWTIGHVEIQKRRTLRSEWSDVLSLIRTVQETWGGEVLFDTKNKVIHLLEKIGKDAGVRFMYEKNLKNMERIIDTYDLVTRIYPQGKGGLDITTVNGGKPYIENTKWVNGLKLRRKIIPYRWKDERYTVPQNLLEDAQKMLDEMAKPKVAYKTNVHDLSTLSGHEHESFELGDTVTAIDKELFGEEIVNRIMRRKQDVRNPEKTEIELAQPIKTLADVQSRALDNSVQNLIESDPLSTTDAQQMTVFNQLLNSRVDDGFNSWVHEAEGTQFEVANAGFSGSWSYKVTPDFNKEARLTQTVEGVSHRSAYTVSAAVATEGRITRGSAEDAFVGIKVLVYYEGEEQPEPHYLAIPDITTQGGEEE